QLQTPRVIEPLATLSLDTDATTARTALQALLKLGEVGERAFNTAFTSEFAKKPPDERAAWGRNIADIDPRPGVGLQPDGLPDIDWVEILAGEFTFGAEDERNGPRKLTLPTFYIARYPVTYQQFQAFIDADDGFHNPQWWKGLAADDDHKSSPGEQAFKYWNHPRERVSWYDAVAFCRWLSVKAGYKITLPTEQQWEKAARGTDGLEYPYGKEYDASKGNTYQTGIGQTSAVGIFSGGASPYDILDMSGNVWEWCLNEYSNPENTGLGGASSRVLRGGSWGRRMDYARASYRDGWPPSFRNFNFGCRCVCAAPYD
ncbi:MAG: formylglycine-generating enzyme family protein, partial [Chloroflexi bacterium]|nr:formylglycine-generating enzyme family protein [Chloroflexota bacterium]